MQNILQKRSIPLYIILCFLTFGIFGLIWFYFIAEDLCREDTPGRLKSAPGMAVLFSLLSCGIYSLYAYYQWGRQMPEVYAKYGLYTEDRGILYLVLGLLRFSIVSIALIQNDLNSLADYAPPLPPGFYGSRPHHDPPIIPGSSSPAQNYEAHSFPIPTASVDTTISPCPSVGQTSGTT